MDTAASPPWVPVYTYCKCALESLSNLCYDSNQPSAAATWGGEDEPVFPACPSGLLSCDVGSDTHHIFHL